MKRVILPALIPFLIFISISLIADKWLEVDWEIYINSAFQLVMGILLAYYLSILNNGKKHYRALASLFIIMGVLNALITTEFQNIIVYAFWICIVAFLLLYINRFLVKHPKRLLDIFKLVTISLFVLTYTSNPYFGLPAFIHPLSFFLMIGIFFYDYYMNQFETQRIDYRKSFLFWIILFAGFFMGVMVILTHIIAWNR